LAAGRDLNSAAIEFDLALKGDSQPAWVQVEAQSMRASVTALVQNRTIVRQVQSEFFVSENEILQKSAPSYSEEARTAGLEGRVLLSGIVTEDGMMPDPRVVQSLGLGLDEMAIAAVKKWRIAPSTLAGKSVASVRTVAVDFALPDKQSRWHLIGARFPSAPGTARPVFENVAYPFGTGISVSAYDEGRLLSAIGRVATATVAFDVAEDGKPVHLSVVTSSLEVWGHEALAMVQGWRFRPGRLRGVPASLPVILDLAWGPKNLVLAKLPRRDTPDLHAADGQIPRIIHAETPPIPLRSSNLSSVRMVPVPVIGNDGPSVNLQVRTSPDVSLAISFMVGEDGAPRDIEVQNSPDESLNQQAIATVAQWRFEPAVLSGRPIPVLTRAVLRSTPEKRLPAK
jgi:TonB family protein